MDQRPNNYNDQGPNGQGPNGNGGPGGPKNKSSLLVLLICVLATLLIWTVFSNILQSSTSKEITYDKFLEMLDKGEVKSVELQSGVLTIVPREQKVEGVEFEYSTTAMEDSTTLTARLLEAEQKTGNKITFNEIQPDPTGSIIYTILSLLVPFVFLIILMNWLMRKMNKGGGMMGVGKSKAKAYVQQETGVTFKDVAGEDEAKESLQEVVDFLHNPGKYTTIGAKLPKGALLVGPPGTGKTLLAKAVAGEAHVPFFSLSGSDFVEMFVGVGASRVRDLFEEAKKNAPCIIFIDEIDAIGKSRDSRYGGGNDEREQTLNQLLAEMDGFDSSKGILILAATNRPEILDPALLRPGRFDRRVIVERPDLKGRVNILKVHAKVRDLFKQANEKAPCIVFIDEIDTIGKKRDGNIGGNDEREQTLNQLLTEMDGFDGSKGVVILAATNRPDSLDPALLRPGRFDRRIPVELPDLQGREEILKVHAKKIKIADNVDFSAIAKAAAGASGAELANIVNEAALRAVRDGRRFATQADMEESIEVVIAGYQKKNRVLSEKEKLIVSYHEIGHALVAAKQTNSAPVHKITIIPRTSGALGYTMQVEDGEHYLMNKEELENKIATFTGGRAAEELIFHSITTGASNDIEQATKLARGMITRYGMSDEFDMVAMENVSNQYLGGDSSLTCSFETQTLIDKKVVELVKQQHEKALQILQDNIMKLHELAKYLYENETITGEEFMQILERQ